MLKIYGVLRSRASRVVWAAKELGLRYEHVPVMQAYRLLDMPGRRPALHTASAAFRAVNPNGQIPSVEDDGLVLHESLAITLYLARKHGSALGPRDAAEDGQMTMWTLWAATGCEPHSIKVLYHLPAAAKEHDPALAAAAVEALRRPFAVLDAALRDGGGHLVGGRFTVADLNVAEVFRYAQPATALFEAHPQVAQWIAACQARPAFREMMAEREKEPA